MRVAGTHGGDGLERPASPRFVAVILRLAALATMQAVLVAPGRAAAPAAFVAGLAVEARAPVDASVDAALQSRSVAQDRSANDLGWDCLAAIELAATGDSRALARLRLVAAELRRDVLVSSAGQPVGWTASIADIGRCPAGAYDAFGDGTCNPPGTAYAFQTGLAVACLARTSTLLRDPAMLDTAREVLTHWQELALARAPCRDCLYFPTSTHANDAGRYVRNMNVFMALGAASVGATGDVRAMELARKAMASELAERSRGNKGYLGMLDPQWIKSKTESDRIENHAASVAVLSRQIAALSGDPVLERHALGVWEDWAFCANDRCRKAACNYWAADPARCQATQTAAHCAFRDADPRALALCHQYLGKVKGVSSFGLWAIGVGVVQR